MRILASPEGDRRVLVFGSGLVGWALLGELGRRGYRSVGGLAVDWTVEAPPSLDLPQGGPIQVVWAAGQAGFASPLAEVQAEVASFEQWLRLLRPLDCELYLISSAGGIFEGSRWVEAGAAPSPLRPYGHAKLAMEDLLVASGLHHRIYRAASIYGPLLPGSRRGLIATLLANARTGHVTRINGRPSTLRDYVSTFDVARFVAAELEARRARGAGREAALPLVLASCRPRSLYEIKHCVEQLVRRPAYVSYETATAGSMANSADIAFAAGSLAQGFIASDLRTGVLQSLQLAR